MRCENCQYKRKTYDYDMCEISHTILNHPVFKQTTGCSYEEDYIATAKICYNCKNWIGGGDFGLSCKADYYYTSSNGFDLACEKFAMKEDEDDDEL